MKINRTMIIKDETGLLKKPAHALSDRDVLDLSEFASKETQKKQLFYLSAQIYTFYIAFIQPSP